MEHLLEVRKDGSNKVIEKGREADKENNKAMNNKSVPDKNKRLTEITEKLEKNLNQQVITQKLITNIAEKETANIMAKNKNMKSKKRGAEAKEDKEKKRIRNESDQETEFDGDQSNEEMEEQSSSRSESQQDDGENDNMEMHQATNSSNPEYGKRVRYIVKNGNLFPERIEERDAQVTKEAMQRFPSNHQGEIIISAALNAESCKIRGVNNLVKIVDKVSRYKWKPVKVIKTGFNTANLYYDKVSAANEILDAQLKENRCDKDISYKIAITKYKKKGVISGWDLPIENLWEAIDEKEKIDSMERMTKKVYNKQNEEWEVKETNNVMIVFSEEKLPDKLDIYGGLTHIRVRTFIPAVQQCHNCYKYGHVKKFCRRTNKRCIICGENAHGICNVNPRCINCGGLHKANYRGCP